MSQVNTNSDSTFKLYNDVASRSVGDVPIYKSIVESVITRLYITKTNKSGEGIVFDIVPWSNPPQTNPFISMNFHESMFSTVLRGSMFLYDFLNWGDEFVLNGTEKIHIDTIESVTTGSYNGQETAKEQPTQNTTALNEQQGNSTENQEFRNVSQVFSIYSITKITDDSAIDIKMSKIEPSSIWKIDFTSEDILLKNFNETFLEEYQDFVGYIAVDSKDENPNEEDKPKGLVNEIFRKFDLTGDIEPTKNGIWLRYNNLSWPWLKRKGQFQVLNLLSYLTNYAESKENPNAVNYFFWKDRYGWNFKSIDKILRDNPNPVDGFIVTLQNDNPNRIYGIELSKEFTIPELYDAGALNLYYNRTDPNYDDPYLDFIDTNYGFTYSTITYDYNKDYDSWLHIDSKKLVNQEFDTGVTNDVGKIRPALFNDDLVYGYMGKQPYNTPFPQWWDHIGKTLSGGVTLHGNRNMI